MQIAKSVLLPALTSVSQIRSIRNDVAAVVLEPISETSLSVFTVGADESFSATVACQAAERRIALNPKLLLSAVEFLDEEINISIKETVVTLRSGKKKIDLSLLDSAVVLPPIDGSVVDLPIEKLVTALKASKFSAPHDSHRTALKSIHVVSDGETLEVHSSRGPELSIYKTTGSFTKTEFMIPNEFASLVIDSLQREEARLCISERSITVEHKLGRYSCKQLEAQYPNMREIFNMPRTQIGVIARDEWVKTFSAIRLMRGKEENLSIRAKMSFTKQSCLIETFSSTPIEQEVDGNFSECVARVNALAIYDCIAVFPEGSLVTMSVFGDSSNAVGFECDGLLVLSTQQRG